MTQRHFKVFLLHKSFDTDVTMIATAEARKRNIRRSHEKSTGVTNFTFKFYKKWDVIYKYKLFEKHIYRVWEVIGPSGEILGPMNIILLNGHVLTLLYKYLCHFTLVLCIAYVREDSYCSMMWLI